MSGISRRQREIISIISNSNNYISGNELSDLLKISGRTVRNEIAELRSKIGEDFILTQMGKGYMISDKYDVHGILSLHEEMPVKRQIMILKDIIAEEGINFFDLADKHFISESTLENDLRMLNEMIAMRFSKVEIYRKNNLIFISANESLKREVTTFMLAKEIKEYNFNFNNYINYFKHFNIVDLKGKLIKFLDDNEIVIRDMALVSLVLHLGIMMDRVYEGEALEDFMVTKINENDQFIVKEFCLFVESLLEMKLPLAERKYLQVIFTSKLTIFEVDEDENFDYHGFIFESLTKINVYYQIDLIHDEQIKQSLYVHLISLVQRAENNRYLTNPLIDDIRENFPFIYDISVFLSLQIQDKLKITLLEDEIGYLSLHFMVAIEKINDEKFTILLINPYGVSASSFIKQRILNSIEMKLDFIFSSNFEDEYFADESVDLILTTVTLDRKYNIPTYQISTMVKDKELETIHSMLQDQIIEREKNINITHLFDENLFFNQLEFSDKFELISFLCDQLVANSYVDDNYIDSVLKRESLAPTAFGGYFAIPHPTEKIALKNGIAIATLKSPIKWSHQMISMVFLFSLTKDSESIMNVFDVLIELLEDERKVKRLIEAKSFKNYMSEFNK